ncbi:glycosyltransferase [Vibrio lamellibrachiae]|uniref:glycosyltransferase family 2 protein n=1 Tax=Vibrio lamellibrachiae TaxID=2910253 RepID=UPI003D0D95B9
MKLSIIVTCYNIAPYIEKCLDSICNQTLRDIEIIVIDDASTDDTQRIVESYQKCDPRIKTKFFTENTIGGVSSAANAGIDMATGDYIGFADGDDWYELDMFEKLVNSAEKNNSDVAFCNYLEFNETTSELLKPSDAGKWHSLKPYDSSGDSSDSFKKAFLRLNPVPWRKIYKRELLGDKIRYPVGDYFFEDNPFHWETTLHSEKISFEDFIGCYHRINRPGQTMSTANFKLIAMYEHHSTILDTLQAGNVDEDYKDQSIAWLIGNTEWITRKIGDQYLKDNFRAFQSELFKYGKDSVNDTLSRIHVGNRGRDLVRFALIKNYRGFKIAVTEQKYTKVDYGLISISEIGFWKTIGLFLKKPLMNMFKTPSNSDSQKLALLHRESIDKATIELLDELKKVKQELTVVKGDLRSIKLAMILNNEPSER